MKPLSKHPLLAMLLLAVALCVQSCNEQVVPLDKQMVQFSLRSVLTDGRISEAELPEAYLAKISIAGTNGSAILTDHEISVVARDGTFVTEPIELPSGAYVITDFMVSSDTEDLYVAPKQIAEITTPNADELPFEFLIDNAATTIDLRVVDVRNQDLKKFGYNCIRARANSLSIAVYENTGGNLSLTSATAELHQNRQLLNVFSLTASVNTIRFGGDSRAPYTLTVYTGKSAKVRTFDLRQLKREIGRKPLRITLEPALFLSIDSNHDAGEEYEEYFDFGMDGSGAVNINWGDGYESDATLPFEISHEYFRGTYKAIITGDLDQVTDFNGFSYGTIIYAITGLTNLTSLKVYDPSWGAVPIKVDLSNCKQLERINIAKYGAPYEPCDLRTDFKLPPEHNISSFVMDATSFDSEREYMSAEELDVMFTNIYNNAVSRGIYGGLFLLNPVVAPAPETQTKIDILRNDYGWTVQFNDEIYSLESARSRSIVDSDTRREQWLLERFSSGQRIIDRGRMTSSSIQIPKKRFQ